MKKNVDAIFQQHVSYIIKKKIKNKNALNFIQIKIGNSYFSNIVTSFLPAIVT